MKAPEFWVRPSLLGGILAPLGWLYGTVSGLRAQSQSSWRAPIPVLCIGNVVAGGAGKTPVALDLGRRLAEKGLDVHFLTRGYGGSERGPHRVDTEVDTAGRVGDEALLLAAQCPTWVAVNRAAGCRAAAKAGADLVVMDDGLQNPSLAKDLSLLVVDGGYGFGNGQVHPAGPLREPLGLALDRAGGVVLIGDDETAARDRIGGRSTVLSARVVPGPEAKDLKGRAILAFAGIGRPEKFFRTLESLNCTLVGTRSFADHHAYRRAEIEALKREAAAVGAGLVTTAKDTVRLPEDLREGIRVLTITLQWEDEAALEALLEPLVRNARSQS